MTRPSVSKSSASITAQQETRKPRPGRLVNTVAGTVGLGLLAGASWWWFVWLSPWGYDRPDHLEPVAPGPHQVFIYGTLRYAPVRYLVMGTAGTTKDAVLTGYRRCGLNIAPAAGEQVKGEVFKASAAELSRLDRYERLGIRYARLQATLENGDTAWVYRRLAPGEEQPPMPIGCPGSDTMAAD